MCLGPYFLVRWRSKRKRFRKYRPVGMMWATWLNRPIIDSNVLVVIREVDDSMSSICVFHPMPLCRCRDTWNRLISMHHLNTIFVSLGVPSPLSSRNESGSSLLMGSSGSSGRNVACITVGGASCDVVTLLPSATVTVMRSSMCLMHFYSLN